MFIRITTSGPRQYVKIVEAYRDEAGVSRQRVIATLGRLETVRAGSADAVVNGLLRVTGKPTMEAGSGEMVFEPARSVGDTWLLTALWKQLGFADAFRRVLRRHRRFDAEHLVRIMVFNRLCEPESKLGVLRWLEGTRMPDVAEQAVTHQNLLRTMDTLTDRADELEATISMLLRPLIDDTLSVVFYDLTTIRTEGYTEMPGELRRHGRAKEGGVVRQVLLGVVQTAEGLPIHHEVFTGDMHEGRTLVPTIQRILARYPIRRVVLVADRGLLSLDNLAEIRALKVSEDQPLEFILAVPARRYGDFDEILAGFHQQRCQQAEEEVIGEQQWQGYRLITAHRPDLAQEQSEKRDQRIAALERDAERWAGKLDQQDSGRAYRGRKLSDAGTTAKFYKAVCDAHLGHILRVDLGAEQFRYDIDQRALDRARMLDGKLLLVTNLPTTDLSAEAVVARYKALADIERGFRVLKNEIEMAPVFHRLSSRIRAHALICFLALLLHRVLRMRLRASHQTLSPERALEIARRIQFHQVTLHRQNTASGLTSLTPEQRQLFAAIDLPEPVAQHV